MKILYVDISRYEYENLRRYEALLPPERREKIARYRFDGDKLRSLVAGLLLRREIGNRAITLGEHGKPYTEGIFFSLSHSGDIVAIAVDNVEVGMDVEQIAEESRLKIAERFYHPNEREAVRSADDHARAFTQIWTRKEAYLKMTGEGISTDLTAFDTTAPPLSEQIVTFDLEGYCLSICSADKINIEDIYISEIELSQII